MWCGSCPEIQPTGLAWGCQWGLTSVFSLAGHSLTVSRISWWIFSSVSASQGLLPDNLCNWYTSLYTPLISSLVDLGPMSLMVDGSTLRSHPGKHSHWPWQMVQSYSFCPVATAWVNIQCNRNRWWNLQGSHHGYLSRKALASSCLSAFCTEMPVSCASFLAVMVLAIPLSYSRISSTW